MLLCDFYSVIQVLVNNRSELLAPCLKCITRLPNKMYNDALVSKSMCQIKHFWVCFPLTCKTSSIFYFYFFFKTSSAKRAPQKPWQRGRELLPQLCRLLSAAISGASKYFLLLCLHPFLFTRSLGITLTTKTPYKSYIMTFDKNIITVL